jgi:hypothetical protein
MDLARQDGALDFQVKEAAKTASKMGLRPFVEFTALW